MDNQQYESDASKTPITVVINNSFIKKIYTRKVRSTLKKKTFWIGVTSAVVIVALLFGLHKVSYNSGYDAGLEEGKKSASLSNSFGNLQNPFQLVSGTVADINNDHITVDTSRGQKQSVKLTDETRITKKTENLSRDSIKKGTKVSVFTKGEQDDLTATRIVIRD